jgi:hypothetical protein
VRIPVVAIALCLAPALAAAQSLGDAAERQARKRGKEAPAARVYTGEDLRPSEADVAEADPPVAGEPEAVPSAAGEPASAAEVVSPPPEHVAEDAVRAQLDREAAERKQRERYWRQVAGAARARLASAQRGHDAACGPGVLVLTGG